MSKDSSESGASVEKKKQHWLGFKNRKPAGFGHPALIITTLLAIFLSSQIVAAIITQSLLSLFGKSIDDIFNSASAQFIFILIAEVLAISAVLWVIKRRGLQIKAIGLGRWPRWGDLGNGLLAFIIFYIILIGLFGLLVALMPELQAKLDEPQEIGFKALGSNLDKVLAFAALVFLAPIGEEILVRGYLYSGLRSLWRFLPAAIVTGLVFGAAHLQPENPGALVWGAALSTFVMSMVLVYLREKTGALYSGMLVHGLNNAVAFTVYFTATAF